MYKPKYLTREFVVYRDPKLDPRSEMQAGGVVQREGFSAGTPFKLKNGQWSVRYSPETGASNLKTFSGTKKEVFDIYNKYKFKPKTKTTRKVAKEIQDILPEGMNLSYDKKYKNYNLEGGIMKGPRDKSKYVYRKQIVNPTLEEAQNFVDEYNAKKLELFPNRITFSKFEELRFDDKYINLTNEAFAKELNKLGFKGFTDQPFTANNVSNLQRSLGITKLVGSRNIEKRPMSEVKDILRKNGRGFLISEFKDNEPYLRKQARAILYREKVNNLTRAFPFSEKKESKLWRHLFNASQQGDRIVLGGTFNGKNLSNPENWPKDKDGKISWNLVDKDGAKAWEKVTFTDTEAPNKKTFRWKTQGKKIPLKQQVDNAFGSGFFERNLRAYDEINKNRYKKILVNGKEVNMNQYLSEQLIIKEYQSLPGKEGKIPSREYISEKMKNFNPQEAHHPEGIAKNPYKIEAASRIANRKLGILEAKRAKGLINDTEYRKEIQAVSDEFGGIRYKVGSKYVGTKGTQETILTSILNQLDPETSASLNRIKNQLNMGLDPTQIKDLFASEIKILKGIGTPAAKFMSRTLGGIVPELAYEAAFAIPSYAQGKDFDQILNETIFGLAGAGKTEREKIIEESDFDPDVVEFGKLLDTREQLQKDVGTLEYMGKPDVTAGLAQIYEPGETESPIEKRIKRDVRIVEKNLDQYTPGSPLEQKFSQAKQKLEDRYERQSEEEAPRKFLKDIFGGLGREVFKFVKSEEDEMEKRIKEVERLGFSGGGFTRRGFLKLIGGLATLAAAVKSGVVKLKTPVAKKVLKDAPKGTPDWFAPLVEKIKANGIDVSTKQATIERESVTVLKVPVLDKLDQPIKVQRSKSGVTIEENVSDTYTLYENPDTGEISVRVDSDAGVNNMPVDFNMTLNKTTGVTDDGKPIFEPGEFVVVEERAVGRQVGPDDYDIDLDEYVTNDLDDAASDWHSVEEFATGKTDKTAQTKKRVRKDAIENDPGEDVVSRQGELMDYNQDDYYD